MRYGFYGWEGANVPPVTDEFPGISNPKDLYVRLMRIWDADTCAPRMRKNWANEHPSFGQCSVTAFLAQDIFGGEVFGVPLPDGNFHCFNRVGNCVFDLTSEQFPCALSYEACPPQSRDAPFAKAETLARYELLRSRLLRSCTQEG
jgi:hypothetical protein